MLSCACFAQTTYDTKLPAQEVSASSFFEHHELDNVVVLDASDDGIVGSAEIERVIVCDNKILIQKDDECVLIFNASDGKLLCKIETDSNLVDFGVSRKDHKVLVYTDDAVLSIYDMTGKFLSRTSIKGKSFEGLIVDSDDTALFYFPDGLNEDRSLVQPFNFTTGEWSKTSKVQSQHFDAHVLGEKWVESNRLIACNHLSTQFYAVNGANVEAIGNMAVPKFIQQSVVDAYQLTSPGKGSEYIRQTKTNDLVFTLAGIRENERYMTMKSNLHPLIWIDKEKGTAQWTSSSDSRFGNNQMVYYPHSANDNRTMFCIFPAVSYSNGMIRRHGFDATSIDFDKIPGHLAQKLRNADGKNTILLFYKE